MKRIPKTGMAHLQQTKSLNSRVITLLHGFVADIKYDGGTYPPNTVGSAREVRDLTRVIKKLAREQVEVKQEIRGQRTSQRVSKKHPPIRAQARGGIVEQRVGFSTETYLPTVGVLPVAASTAP